MLLTGGATAFAQDAMVEELKQEMKTPAETNQPVAQESGVVAPEAPVPAVAKEPPPPVVDETVEAVAAPVIAPKAEVAIEELAPVPEVKQDVVPVVKPAAESPALEAERVAESELGTAPVVPVSSPAEGIGATVDTPNTSVPAEAVKQLGTETRTELGKQLAQLEEVRRQARELEGRKSIDLAERAWKAGDYLLALTHYRSIVEKLPATEPNTAVRKRATDRIPECEFQVILGLAKQGKKAEALSKGKEAATRNPDNRAIAKLVAKLQADADITPPPEGPVDPKKPGTSDQMLAGKRQMANREYERARESFESVLALDPGNREAMRYLKELGERKYVSESVERNATAAKMTAQVKATWNPQYRMIKGKTEVDAPKPPDPLGTKSILDKMGRITIPEVEFRQANIHDVVEFLNKASVDGDKLEQDPTKKGVNIILNLGGAAGAAPAAAAPSADNVFGEAAPAGGGGGGGKSYEITFTARYITLLSALKIITSVSGLKWRVDGNIVMIVQADFDPSEIEVRMYSVEPTFVERIREAGSAMPSTETFGGREVKNLTSDAIGNTVPELKDYFEKMGVKFPKGSSITYNSAIGKVIVGNTAENLAIFERILPELNVVPKQVEIEARFVEVNETDLQEFGLEWLLNDAWEMASKKGGAFAPLGSTERVQMNANASEGGFTKGNRFWGMSGNGVADGLAGGQGTMGKVLSISSVLTNPELTMVLHMLQQNGNADLLSAPKVTTRSGAEATIRVVTEFIYPTTFEVQGGSLQGAANANQAQTIQETTVVPQDFATREVGVILTVLPEVSPDGNMINLTMTPQVVTEPTWYQYGSTIRRADGSESVLNMPQPFFHVRSLSTQISIYDGATVVMGGLITEDLRKVNDKIPVLGDIPLLGALFRSKTEQSVKKNLLIFVSAKLVDPAGRTIRNPEMDSNQALTTPAPVASATAQP
jgi:general secretion pathway protein D